MHTIAAAVRCVGVARSTLLYYERIGLIRPVRDPSNGYRRYSDRDLERLILLKQLQQAGLSLAECRQCLDGHMDAALLAQRLVGVETQLQSLLAARSVLMTMQQRLSGVMPDTADFSKVSQYDWHAAFVSRSPEAYRQFLQSLGYSKKESFHLQWVTRDMNEHQEYMQVFFQVFEGMKRQGPGNDAITRGLLQKVMSLHSPQRILDMGCGKGASALVLARETQAQVVALDNHQPFVDALQQAAAEGLDQISAILGSMDEPDKITGTFDLIWSEGSAYIIGYERALKLWRPLLTETGYLFVSDLVQLDDELAPEARTFLEQQGVILEHTEDRIQQAKTLGYKVLDSLAMPQQGWQDYYTDMEQQIGRLEPEVGKDHPALSSLRQEIDIYRRFGHQYGYVCLLMQKVSGRDE